MTDFSFSPKTVAIEPEKKLAIQRLPAWAQNSEQIQKYFDDCVQHWFTPEQQRTLDGYIGAQGGANTAGKVFINEITPARSEYQLAPTMVSSDSTNTVQSMLTYPDLVNNLAFNGALANNESRLLSGRFYSWAPAINPDMLVNYNNYYWDTTNSNNIRTPDYVVMERGSRDGNMWSQLNYWYPVQYVDTASGATVVITDDDITSGRFIQAQRPIVEFIKDIELFNYGRNARGSVDLLASTVTPEDLMFRDVTDNIRVDGKFIENGDRILFTSINNPGENNRIYKVVIERKNGRDVYGLILDPIEMTTERLSGEPVLYDTIRVKRGNTYAETVVFWNGVSWDKGQQKTQRNQPPLFTLYDKNKVMINEAAAYPQSTFVGSKLFAVKINETSAEDSIYEQQIQKDKFGNFVYQNHIQSDTYTYTKRGIELDIAGMKFYNVMAADKSNDELFSDWREATTPTRQYVTQTIIPTKFVADKDISSGVFTYNREYKLSVAVGTDTNVHPLVRVDINGETLDPSEYTINKDQITLLKYELDEEVAILVHIYNSKETPNRELGAYEIPSNLKNNAGNDIIEVIEESRLADHFYDIIQNQDNFSGSAVGINNFYDTKRDMAVGRKIVQHDASLIPLMVHNSSDRLDIIKAADFSKTSYNSFKNKFINSLDLIDSAGYSTQSAAQVVSQILKKINIGKSDEFAFWLSGMATSETQGQAYIPATPQYLGMQQLFMPKLRVRSEIDTGLPTLYNVTHTGNLTRAYSNIRINNGTETIDRDFRDDVLFELELQIFKSINKTFSSDTYIPYLSVYDVRPGVFRTTEYTSTEWDRLSLRSFEQWAISNQVDYRTNEKYDASNWKTWNYSGTLYRSNSQPARGNWKAIYMDHFDTYEPNTKPWEMLGFTIKPMWWDEEYEQHVILPNGTKSYVSQVMWDHIQEGRIMRGDRVGIDLRFARQDFKLINPVQADGSLIAPHLSVTGRIAIVDRKPTTQQDEWNFGDIGDVEFSYSQSNHYAFEQAITMYRAKPAQWANYFWDTSSYKLHTFVDQQQWLKNTTDERLRFSPETVVHGEDQNRVIGYQMWVSDMLKHNHMDITRSYGNLVRGSGVKLSYRLGGFSKKEQLTFVSDSFGLVSQENQQLSLLKSSVRKQEVLSGVNVRFDRGQYIVSGYDSSNPYFKYFEPVRTGRRYAIQFGSRTLVQYQEYKTVPTSIRYDTKFRTIQEVYDFLVGYGEYLDHCGWIFEELTDEGEFFDWRSVAADFGNWALSGQLITGEYISLSPVPVNIKFVTEHGNIDSVAQFSGGSWTLVDDNNSGIGMHEINVSRIGNIINVRLNENVDKRIMLIRVNVSEYEHAVVFDNTTIFGDVMFIPSLGLYQQRLRAYGVITDGWNGRLEAPGFMVVDNTTLPNFEKLVNDFKHYYDSENPTSSVELNNLARHAIGYQSREYLRRLILNERNQVEFYKGYIKEKGTVQSFDKILRTSKNLRTPNYKVIEEWAFKIGEYGDVDNDQRLEFLLHSNELKQEPQNVVFDEAITEDVKYDDVVTYFGTKGADDRWLTRSSANQIFPMVSRSKNTMDLPTVGPVTLSEVDIVVKDITGLAVARNKYFKKHNKMPQKVWMLDNQGTWDILVLQTPSIVDGYAMSVRDIEPYGVGKALFNFPASHGLYDNDIFFLYAEDNAHPELNVDAYYQWNGLFTDTQILANTNASESLFRDEIGGWITPIADTPYLYVYRSMFATTDRAQWVSTRSTDLVDVRSFKRPVIYNRDTHQTDTYLTLWDPMQGVIPGIADAEVNFKSQNDPAMYNNMNKDSASWGASQVGQVWWDTSNALYLDYTQMIIGDPDATREYRRENWGKMLPGGTVDLYEWVRSPKHPVEWDDFVATQSVLNKTKGTWIPSGTALQNQWCEISEYDPNGNDFKVYYYFWVKGAIHTPNVKSRQRSVAEITRIITDPKALNLPWFAPISVNEFIVSGISSLITDDDSVLQLVYRSLEKTGNVHKQWQLFQEGSSYNFDSDIWQSMVDSLCGQSLVDDKGIVAEMRYPLSELGNKRGDTWFINNVEARREFAATANTYFKSINMAANSVYMNSVFNYVEDAFNPYDREFNVVSVNGELVLHIKDPERFINNDAIIMNTVDTLPTPIEKSLTYFIERVSGETDKFKLKTSPSSASSIALTDKGSGTHTITRVIDSSTKNTAALDMTSYWNVVDWYDVGYSASTSFTEAPSTLAADQLYFSDGDVIKVTDDSGVWTLYARSFSRNVAIWKTVGRKNSTIELNSKLYEEHTQRDVNGILTNAEIITHKAIRLLSTVFTSVQSLIVFPMIYYVHTEQKVIDWVFKTSYISIMGIDKALSNESVTTTDPLADVTSYINEVKPYRVKIRGSIDQRTSDTELIAAKTWDTDSRQSEHDAYVAEFNKPDSEQDFSVIGSNFRQQQEIVLFDHVSVTPRRDLLDSATYDGLFSKYMLQNDNTVRLPAELTIENTPNAAFSGIYTEILSNNYPTMDSAFHPYSVEYGVVVDVVLDRSRKTYKRTHAGREYFCWSSIGFGWMISTKTALGIDWYYEDTKRTNSVSVDSPMQVANWASSEGNPGSTRSNVSVSIQVREDIATRMNPDLRHNAERFMRNVSHIEQEALRTLNDLLFSRHQIDMSELNEQISKYLTPTSTGGVYFDLQNLSDICRDKWNLTDEQIISLVTEAMKVIDTITIYLDTANRTKIYNPDASDEYIKAVVNGGFKGVQIHNQPNFRGQVGYSAQSSDSMDGYTLWSPAIYEKLASELKATGLSDVKIKETLSEYGYGPLVNYAPYENIDTVSKSVNVAATERFKNDLGQNYTNGKSYKPNGMNDSKWDANNPLTNSDHALLATDDIKPIVRYVDDQSNYDNLGYDKQTRTIEHSDIAAGTYLFDIQDLQVEDKQFGKLTATISNYTPEILSAVDFGLLSSAGKLIPGTTVGSLQVDYLRHDNFQQNTSTLFSWDFGSLSSSGYISDNGSFSVEGTVIRDPKNPNRIVVSAPRTIKSIVTEVNSSDIVYPKAERSIYPFTLELSAKITNIRIGKHTLRNDDLVLLFANDFDNGAPQGAFFDQVDSVYTVKVIDDQTVSLMNGTIPVVLNTSGLKAHYQFGTSPVYSMFHLVKPKGKNDIRIDTLNYSKFYGRYLSGGTMFNKMAASGNNIIRISNHGLTTGTRVNFTSSIARTKLGGLKLNVTYYVLVVDSDSINIVPTINDAILSTNQISVGDDVGNITMSVVNFWLSSTTQSTRRKRNWHFDHNTLTGDSKVHNMSSQFANDQLISETTDEVVDHGFARPQIAEGSLRDLVRARIQEHVSITVYQQDPLHAPFAFNLAKSPSDQTWVFKRLNDTSTVKTTKETWYNDDKITVDKTVPVSGIIEINGELIRYRHAVEVVGGFEISSLQRGDQYTHEALYIPIGTLVNVYDNSTRLARSLTRTQAVSDSIENKSDYQYASTLMFDSTFIDFNPANHNPLVQQDDERNGYYFEALKDDNTLSAKAFKELTGDYKKLTGLK